jgi:hypothetical protein
MVEGRAVLYLPKGQLNEREQRLFESEEKTNPPRRRVKNFSREMRRKREEASLLP